TLYCLIRCALVPFSSLLRRRPLRSTLFPYTTLFRSVEGFNRAAPVVGPSYVDVTTSGRKLRRGARLWTVAVATFKSETYRFLRRSEEHTSELQSRENLVCRLLLEKKKKKRKGTIEQE